MISRCGLMQKKDGMGMEEFKDYWLNVHGPIASTMANLRKYDQHVVVDSEHRHALGRGSVVIDGYSELQFDSYGDMLEGVASLHGEGVDDIPKFANPHCQILVLAKREVIRIPEYLRGKKLIQRVSFLGRAEGVSSERFVKEWWNVHDRGVQPEPRHRPHRRRRIRSVRGASCRRRRGDVVRNERSVRRVLRFPRIRARLCAQLGVHRGDQHLPDRNLSGCLAVCIGACDLPSKKLRFSKEEAREKGSTI